MKTRQITDYEIYYYFSAIEQYMLEMMDEKFFVDNMLNYKSLINADKKRNFEN